MVNVDLSYVRLSCLTELLIARQDSLTFGKRVRQESLTYGKTGKLMTKVDRKALQLCRQIERTLGLVLGGELNDDRVRDLLVLSVVPAPNSNHLLVTLQAPEPLSQEELWGLDHVLAEHKGQLRAAMAADISRRKTPEITLRVINPM